MEPAEPAQHRYEALRCYFVDEASAETVGERFGYSPATVFQLSTELRDSRSSFFRSSKPGPKGPRKTTTIRDRVLVLRSQDRSVTQIAASLGAEGQPVSAQTVWTVLKAEGLERLEHRGPGGPAPRLEPVRAKAIGDWPTGAHYDCDHAGLYLLMPAFAELRLDTLLNSARYPGTPGTKVLSSFHSLASFLLLKPGYTEQLGWRDLTIRGKGALTWKDCGCETHIQHQVGGHLFSAIIFAHPAGCPQIGWIMK